MSLGTQIQWLMPLFLATGCYMANSETDTGVEGSASGLGSGLGAEQTESGDGSSEGGGSTPVGSGRGILVANGFKLYWAQTSVWDGGACMELRLKNEGGPVNGWEFIVGTSPNLENWVDDGGAFFFPEPEQIWVEQTEGGELGSYGIATMYFCAEPAVELTFFDVWYREGTNH